MSGLLGSQELEKQISSFGREREKHVKAAQAKLKAARSGAEIAKTALKVRPPGPVPLKG